MNQKLKRDGSPLNVSPSSSRRLPAIRLEEGGREGKRKGGGKKRGDRRSRNGYQNFSYFPISIPEKKKEKGGGGEKGERSFQKTE